jgi:hypothetical protein
LEPPPSLFEPESFEPESFESDSLEPESLEPESLSELFELPEPESDSELFEPESLSELLELDSELFALESESELLELESLSELLELEPLREDVAFDSDLVSEPPPEESESFDELDSVFGASVLALSVDAVDELVVAAADPLSEPEELEPPRSEFDVEEEPEPFDELEPPSGEPAPPRSEPDPLEALSAVVIGAVRALSADPAEDWAGAESRLEPDPVTACVAPPTTFDRAPAVFDAAWVTAATGSLAAWVTALTGSLAAWVTAATGSLAA